MEESTLEFGRDAPTAEDAYWEYGTIFIVAGLMAALFVGIFVAAKRENREFRIKALKRKPLPDPTAQNQADK